MSRMSGIREAADPFRIHTDLAVEERESFPGDGGEIAGVEVHEKERQGGAIRLTEVVIRDEAGARVMGKPAGIYVTLEAQKLTEKDESYHKEVTEELARELRRLLCLHGIADGSFGEAAGTEKSKRAPRILAVGLGNAAATPDSLGPRVLSHLTMTRHLEMEYGEGFCVKHGYPVLSGIVPGVMAQTGMETAEILKGIVRETKPEALLVVDALAARSVRRLGTTIQLSDTGIHPGSGVGNHRNSLTEETLGVPVLALGVPTVVGAAAIVRDTADVLAEAQACGRAQTMEKPRTDRAARGESAGEPGAEKEGQRERYTMLRTLLEPRLGSLYVTPHNIDERVELLSFTISEAIHQALFPADGIG